MTDLPAEIKFGKVVGLFLLAIGDSEDAASMPDALPAVGTIKFIPQPANQRVISPLATLTKRPPICPLDDTGHLVDGQGNPGVWLAVGTYDVYFTLKNIRLNPITILVTEEHTLENPLDLAEAIPPANYDALTDSQYAELSDRIGSQWWIGPPGPPGPPGPASTVPGPPGASTDTITATVRRQAPQTSTKFANTKVVWDQLIEDTGGIVPVLANGPVVPATGPYLVHGQMSLLIPFDHGAEGYFNVSLSYAEDIEGYLTTLSHPVATGPISPTPPAPDAGPNYTTVNFSRVLHLYAGDTIEMRVYQTNSDTEIGGGIWDTRLSLSSLRGSKGDPGAPGAPGGPPGPPGEPGAPGDDGVDGVNSEMATATVRRNAQQNITAGTTTTLVWDTLVEDTGGMVSSVAAGPVVPSDGPYLISGQVAFQVPVATSAVGLYDVGTEYSIDIGGFATPMQASLARGPMGPVPAGDGFSATVVPFARVAYLRAGDVIPLKVYQTNSNLKTYGGLNWDTRLTLTALQGGIGPPGVANFSWHTVTNPATDIREASERVMWVGGSTKPVNMAIGDLWVKDAT